jgi:hypothetical protein
MKRVLGFRDSGDAHQQTRRRTGDQNSLSPRSFHFTMSDDEDVEQFETADSGASTTIPMQAGNVRKGGFMVIKGRPTKVRFPHNSSVPKEEFLDTTSFRWLLGSLFRHPINPTYQCPVPWFKSAVYLRSISAILHATWSAKFGLIIILITSFTK